ncbi:uncharacterized protein LOC142588112 isoform X1 [Dermacentor variabilis]|uniref:uncharacterized protein LOC142588112 isoform X1 n=1 Tax=Dermacentor variabilis TaxID=34621 RepID=UPI003F5C4228
MLILGFENALRSHDPATNATNTHNGYVCMNSTRKNRIRLEHQDGTALTRARILRSQDCCGTLRRALRMREKIRVLQCTVNNLQDRDKERVFQVMQYNRLDGRKLATWLCTPAAQFALPKVFKRRQLRRFVTTGIRCQNALMGNVYDTNAHNHAIGLPPSYE